MVGGPVASGILKDSASHSLATMLKICFKKWSIRRRAYARSQVIPQINENSISAHHCYAIYEAIKTAPVTRAQISLQ